MPYFSLGGILILILQFAFAAHVIRTGRSLLWLLPIIFIPLLGCIAYAVFALVPDTMGSAGARRFADDVANMADPGRGYREKKRDVEMVGSVQSKKALAEECIKRGRFQDAVDLYESAMTGPLGAEDTSLLNGLARARLLAGNGAGAQEMFEKLKAADPAAFQADAELDYARALALQGKNDEALAQYEKVLPTYPGEEARARYGLLLMKTGQADRAKAVFREIVESVRGAPGYYKRRQREWVNIARQNL